METIFNEKTRNNIIVRIKNLDTYSTPIWGKMNVYQMLKHCKIAEEMYLGKTQYPRMFLGRLIGQRVLKSLLKDDSPMGKNAPTNSAFIVKEQFGDVEAEKLKWISLIEEYSNYNKAVLEHWFFGDMNKEQVGQFVFKHADHHLRQFNC